MQSFQHCKVKVKGSDMGQSHRFAHLENTLCADSLPSSPAIQPQVLVVSARTLRVILIFSASAFRRCSNSGSLQLRRAVSSRDAFGLVLGGFDPFAAAVMRAELFAHLFGQFHPKLFLAQTPDPPQ